MSNNNKNFMDHLHLIVVIMGGSKGRPTDPWLKACPRLTSPDVNPMIKGCTPARRDLRTMIKTNDYGIKKEIILVLVLFIQQVVR